MMRSFLSAAAGVLTLLLLQDTCSAFTSNVIPKSATRKDSSVSLLMKTDRDDRRAFLSKIASVSAAATAATFLPTITPPALAFGNGLSKINAKLGAYGLPLLKEIPGGFSPLLELYGKAKNRQPLLVEFLFPSDWVVTLPNIDVNGEEGTIQVGQYSAGDTATLYVWKEAGDVEDVTEQPKEFYQNAVIKAISQKGDNIYQNFKIVKAEPTTGEYKKQKYMLVDFKYELLTGAGFEVDRRGVASITNQGGNVQVLWTASTRQRFKKTEESLRTIASSFRCYSEGVGLQLAQAEDLD